MTLALLHHQAGEGDPLLPGFLRYKPLLGAGGLRRSQRNGPRLRGPGGDRQRRVGRRLPPPCYERGRDIVDPYHYLPALLQKPRAFHQARAVRRYPWPPSFRQALAFLEERHPDGRGVREFLRILTLKDQVGERRLSEALDLALRYRCVGARCRPSPPPPDGDNMANRPRVWTPFPWS